MGWFDSLFGGDRMLRDPEFAGVQYPAEPEALERAVDSHLRSVEEPHASPLRGIVAPHGDYDYAGPVMGAAYGLAARAEGAFERAILVASSGRVPFRGLAVAGYDALASPVGESEVDLERMQEAADRDLVRPIEAAFEPAAALELQLPFLQCIRPDLSILPVLVGDVDVAEVERFLEAFWGEKTLLIIAAYLSEGHERSDAESLDASTVRALEERDEEAIDRRHTSARLPLQGLVRVADERGYEVEAIARATSADTAGDADKVVGYAAVGVWG